VTAHENHQPVESFINSYLTMLRHIKICLQGLLEQPDRPDWGSFVIEPSLQMFHSMHERAGLLGMGHVAQLALVMTDFLEKLLGGTVRYTPRHIALVAESCTFLEQGLALISKENNDSRLAASTASLVVAIKIASSQENDYKVDRDEHHELPKWMRDAFFSEVDHLLVIAEQECVLWDFIAVDLERVADLGRILRLLEQRFAVYGFVDPERLCGALASTLTRYVHGDFFQTAYPERILLRTIDAVREAAKHFVETGEFTIPDADQLATSIQGMMRQPIGEMLVAAGLVDSTTINRALEVQHASPDNQPPRLGEVLVAMGAVTPEHVQRLLQEQQSSRVRIEQMAPAAGKVSSNDEGCGEKARTPETDHLDVRQLSRMTELVEQLLAMRLAKGSLPLLVELREHLHNCHRAALHGLAHRLRQVALDLATKCNKRLHCQIDGIAWLHDLEESNLLVESLLQLITNAVEHGIESIEERLLAGKEKVGLLRVTVTQVDTELCIAVEDDGRGFDFSQASATIIIPEQMAKDTGSVAANWVQFEQMLARAAAEQVQFREDSAGKHGLVAVYTFLREQGGLMEVTSHSGKGTCVTLCLPLTPGPVEKKRISPKKP